jgi:uncharacterized protein (TIGR02145 family)
VIKKASLIISAFVMTVIISTSCGTKVSNEALEINDFSTTIDESATIEASGNDEKSTISEASKLSEASIPNEVTIGNQVWKTKNLNVNKFRNGDLIPEAKNFEEWELSCKNSKPIWCYYNFDSTKSEKYGKLYNIFALRDPRILAPEGFRLPNENDWMTLVNYIGGKEVAGKKLKSTSDWMNNGNGTNFYGWSGLPGGFINGKRFYYGGNGGNWWGGKALLNNSSMIDFYSLDSEYDKLIYVETGLNEMVGMSVRCLYTWRNIQKF